MSITVVHAEAGKPNILVIMADDVYCTNKSAINHFFYYYETSLSAIRVGPWKVHFAAKEGYFDDMVSHIMPTLFNLRKDPFEHNDDFTSFEQLMHKSWVMQSAIGILANYMETCDYFPLRQSAALLNINKAIDNVLTSGNN